MKTAELRTIGLFLAFVVLCSGIAVQGVNIKVVNRCTYPITAFARSGSSSTNSYKLAARGGSQNLNVGTSWPAGIVFATKDGSQNNAETTQLELTVGGSGGQDFYDISLVNAYNLPASIKPSNSRCKAPSCVIPNLSQFCKAPNVNGGDFCTNTDGPGNVATAGTRAFKAACPQAYSYSKDDQTSTYTCQTGGDYTFTYCPST